MSTNVSNLKDRPLPPVIAIGNHKGGVGKTITSLHLAAGLAKKGRRILVIDADPQANLSTTLLPEDFDSWEKHSVWAALEAEKGDLASFAIQSNTEDIDILPNSYPSEEWANKVQANVHMDLFYGLQRLWNNDSEKIRQYDYVIIDTPPAINVHTKNSIMVSDYVLIPIPVGDSYAIDGFADYYHFIKQARQAKNNIRPELLGVLLVKDNKGVKTCNEFKAQATKYFQAIEVPVFKTVVRNNIDLAKAITLQQSIFDFDPKKNGAIDYRDVVEELEEMIQGRNKKEVVSSSPP